jgi:DNA invertase Pin-like site-specific DNA recombinase
MENMTQVHHENKQYGYARVSTREQNEKRQLIALTDCGVHEDNIFVDHQSGKDFNRPMYQRLMTILRPGDTLFIKSIDRLGRNYDEILDQWRVITKDMHVYIVVLDIPLLDTREQRRDLTGTLIADLVLQILSYVAQTEREFIRQRQAEGIAVARAKGIKFGREKMARPDIFPMLREAWFKNEISGRKAAVQLGVTPRTFFIWAREGL